MPATILVIEDNPINMELATDLLEVFGYCVRQATCAEDGVAQAQTDPPDLILMDLSLPGMDGLTATRLLRSDPVTSGIPIVVLTANAMKGDEEKAREAGADGYIAKPIDTRAFSRLIASYLQANSDS